MGPKGISHYSNSRWKKLMSFHTIVVAIITSFTSKISNNLLLSLFYLQEDIRDKCTGMVDLTI